jgi:sepiapterin reductase
MLFFFQFLWARNETKLQETRRAINAAASGHNVDVQVTTTGVDLADQASYAHHVEALVETLQQQPAYETIYVVHNAASVGTLGPAQAWQSAREIAAYWELNLTHMCFLNARLLAAFKETPTRLVLVNVSSNVAVTPFGGCGLYCTGKAAREMHFRVIAEETKKDENRVRVLNYWPGALDTQMQDELRESPAFPDEIHAVFVGFKEQVREP